MTADELGKFLDELGKRIGPTGEYVWRLTVRQVVIDGIFWGIAGIVIALVGLFLVIRIWRLGTDVINNEDREFGAAILGVGCGAAIIFGGIAGVVSLTTLLNPEYHAIEKLLEAVHP